MILFISPSIRESLNEEGTNELLMDATITICPSILYQHLTEHYTYKGLILPGMKVLMSSKKKDQYLNASEKSKMRSQEGNQLLLKQTLRLVCTAPLPKFLNVKVVGVNSTSLREYLERSRNLALVCYFQKKTL